MGLMFYINHQHTNIHPIIPNQIITLEKTYLNITRQTFKKFLNKNQNNSFDFNKSNDEFDNKNVI